jgi:hypothetical protein
MTQDNFLPGLCHSTGQMMSLQATGETKISFHLMACMCRLSYQIILNESGKMKMGNEEELESLSNVNFKTFLHCVQELKNEDESTRSAWYANKENQTNAMAELKKLQLPKLTTRLENENQQIRAGWGERQEKKEEEVKTEKRHKKRKHGSLDVYFCISLYGREILENLEKAKSLVSRDSGYHGSSFREIEKELNENIRDSENELKQEIDEIIGRCRYESDSIQLKRGRDEQTQMEIAMHLLYTLQMTKICRSVHGLHGIFVCMVDCNSKKSLDFESTDVEKIPKISDYVKTLNNIDDFKKMDVSTLKTLVF